MTFEQIKCPVCGNTEQLKRVESARENTWQCLCCNAVFMERLAKREFEKLEAAVKENLGSVVKDALLREKTDEYYNHRALLWEKITANYIDSKAVVKICRNILAISKDDFLAKFFEAANSAAPKDFAPYIAAIDERENEIYIDVILNFIINSLRAEYVNPTAALLDRCGKLFTPKKKQEYLDKFETEAKKVVEGMYEVELNRDVFLAYSSKDMAEVVKVLDFLESDEIGLSCFAAFRNLQHGRDAVSNYKAALEKAINHCSIFLFVSSANSRSFSSDAMKELLYIRDSEKIANPGYTAYEQIPEQNKKLRIEYRLDNKETIADNNVKEFFSGLTWVENQEQLRNRIVECMNVLHGGPVIAENVPDADKKAAVKPQKKVKAVKNSNAEILDISKCEIKDGVLQKYTGQQSDVMIPGSITAIGEFAFSKCNTLTSVIVPEGVTDIGKYAFEHCEKLKSVSILGDVTQINDNTFDGCKNLITAELPENLKSISSFAFDGCVNLKNVVIPAGTEEIGTAAFRNCNISNLKLPTNLTHISNFAFRGSRIADVVIPEGVTNIGQNAFEGCSMMTSLYIPKGVETIEKYAFRDCYNLKNVVIPDTVTVIGEGAFSDCRNLMKIQLSENITVIENKMFENCIRLEELTVPSNVVKIGARAFYQCQSIETLRVPDSVTSIGVDALWGCHNVRVYDALYNGNGALWDKYSGYADAFGTSVTNSNKIKEKLYYWSDYKEFRQLQEKAKNKAEKKAKKQAKKGLFSHLFGDK